MSSVDGAPRPGPLRWRPAEPGDGRRRRRRLRGGRAVLIAAVLIAAGLLLSVLWHGSAGADPSVGDWQKLRTCESGGHYGIVATHGHYGAYQFDLPTWRSVGGVGLPSDASPDEQDYRALYLYRMRGWQPWECAGIAGLRPDADAGTKRVPDRAESRYMAPGATKAPARPATAGGPPAWPGRVFAPGDCADELKAWQLRMNNYGYAFTGTGCYGDKTARAVLDVQAANGLRTSGLLGPRTWQAAWTGTPPVRR